MSLFTKVVSKIPKRNAFNLSFENLLTAEFGQLIPVSCKEILPGDSFRQSTEAVVKTAPMLAPVFSRIDLYLHYFFVPCRLLQEDFEEFITTGIDGLSDNLTPPTATLSQLSTAGMLSEGSLGDYLDLPILTSSDLSTYSLGNFSINMLPFLCYQKVFSDWYKDELLDSFEFEKINGGAMTGTQVGVATTMRYRAWHKDYFTSARPNTQLGNPVQIPVVGSVISSGDPLRFAMSSSSSSNLAINRDGSSEEDLGTDYADTGAGQRFAANMYVGGSLENKQYYADGLTIGDAGVSVQDLRRAIRLQEWQEKNMRGGNRYIENIFHHFGVKSSDARLQRSELLGGRKIPITVAEVTQTSAQMTDAATEETTPLGQLAGKGASAAYTGKIKWHAEEHGFIIAIASIMPKAGYMQGLPRMYWRKSYLDYAWPLFGNLGEQEVYDGEIYMKTATPGSTFGYQSRYAEYKFSPNTCHGAFRSSMAYWHNYRIFDSAPSLNSDFVHLEGGEDDSTLKGQNRIFPTLPDGYGHFYLHLYHDIKVLRALPKYGIPSI